LLLTKIFQILGYTHIIDATFLTAEFHSWQSLDISFRELRDWTAQPRYPQER
jgi:hypothetical protein